tara:strand:- start:52 stop:303 length:252 start_codon:yes stop_codon:yes gene_type:complete
MEVFIRDHDKAFENMRVFANSRQNNAKVCIQDYMYMYTKKYSDGRKWDIFKNIHTRHNEAVIIPEKPNFIKTINNNELLKGVK